jgi:hypothetical protein
VSDGNLRPTANTALSSSMTAIRSRILSIFPLRGIECRSSATIVADDAEVHGKCLGPCVWPGNRDYRVVGINGTENRVKATRVVQIRGLVRRHPQCQPGCEGSKLSPETTESEWMPWSYCNTLARLAASTGRIMISWIAAHDLPLFICPYSIGGKQGKLVWPDGRSFRAPTVAMNSRSSTGSSSSTPGSTPTGGRHKCADDP